MGRTALITGGASGLGLACAERLAVDGVRVLTLDLNEAADYTADVSDETAIQAVAAQVGPIEILVNSAGIVGPSGPFLGTTREAWLTTLNINLIGTVTTMHCFLPGMVARGWGRVVNIASVAGKEGNPNLSPYAASKAAVISVTKSVGKELATTGVLINAIAPGQFLTPMSHQTAPDVLQHFVDAIPMRRPGRPEELAELAAWLSSDKVSFSTGAIYDISGGRATY